VTSSPAMRPHRRVWPLLALLVACSTATSPPTTSTTSTVADQDPLTSATTSTAPAPTTTSVAAGFDVLIFHRTEGFRHTSIEAGIEAISALGEENGFTVTATEDPGVFSDSTLSPHEVVVFLSTTGDVLDTDQEQAMERFVAAGGGFVGVHAAADTEYEWAWYGELVGAYFEDHPEPQQATLEVVSAGHPVIEAMPSVFERFDEWYNFRAMPGEGVTILVTVDETTYQGGKMGEPHPISWAHETLGGRSFYTAMGHTDESFAEPLMLTHLVNGILWAARRS